VLHALPWLAKRGQLGRGQSRATWQGHQVGHAGCCWGEEAGGASLPAALAGGLLSLLGSSQAALSKQPARRGQ